MPSINAVELKWRTGRRNPQVLHAQVGELPSDTDPIIGMMNSAQLSREAVASHNAIRERQKDS